MKPSCRFAMAVHVLALLAYRQGDWMPSGLLAASVNTNPAVIRRLLQALQVANLVETRQGAGLGSRLNCPAARINLAEVYRAVEDHEPFILPPRQPNGAWPVAQGVQAALGHVFAVTQIALERALARTTLADILEAAQPRKSILTGQLGRLKDFDEKDRQTQSSSEGSRVTADRPCAQ